MSSFTSLPLIQLDRLERSGKDRQLQNQQIRQRYLDRGQDQAHWCRSGYISVEHRRRERYANRYAGWESEEEHSTQAQDQYVTKICVLTTVTDSPQMTMTTTMKAHQLGRRRLHASVKVPLRSRMMKRSTTSPWSRPSRMRLAMRWTI